MPGLPIKPVNEEQAAGGQLVKKVVLTKLARRKFTSDEPPLDPRPATAADLRPKRILEKGGGGFQITFP